MKKLTLIILLFLLLAGCNNDSATKEKELVALELTNYLEKNLSSIENIEKDTIVSFNTFVSDKNKTTNEFINFLENKIIPEYQDFYDKLNAISPPHKEIAVAHDYYKTSAKYQLDAFNIYLEGLIESDYEKIKSVNSFINSSKEYLNMHRNELINIAKKYDIKYTLTQ